MKFTDGYWRLREGVHAVHPVEVLDAVEESGKLVVHAPTQRLRDRGDMLKGPVVTIECTSPLPGVIGVKITHFAGGGARRAPVAGRGGGPPGGGWGGGGGAAA